MFLRFYSSQVALSDTPSTVGSSNYVRLVVSGTTARAVTIKDGGSNISTVDTIGAADPLRTAGTYTIGESDYTTDASGVGAKFSVVVDNNGAATVTVTTGGSGYVINETITIDDSKLGNGGAADLTFDVATIGTANIVTVIPYSPLLLRKNTTDTLEVANGVTDVLVNSVGISTC